MAKRGVGNLVIGWGIAIACIPLVVLNLHGRSSSGDVPAPVADTTAQAVTEAAPFTIGHFSVAGRWRLVEESTGDFRAERLAVTNTDTRKRRAFFTMTLLDKGVVVTRLDCATPTIRPGRQATADCVDISSGDYSRKFDSIRVEPTF